jgi:biotin transporter BioY
MKYAKDAAYSQLRAGSLTALTFVRAACLVTLLVGATWSFTFLAMAVVLGNTIPISIGLVLLLCMTLASWMIAAVLGTVLLVPKWIWAKTQDQLLRTRCWTAARSSVWDEWLDGAGRA